MELKLAHSFAKVSLLTVCFSVNKSDIVGLSETFLSSEIVTDDENLLIPGYSIARVDHPFNTKRGSVCVYYVFLPLKLLDVKYSQECINLEVISGDNVCSFIILYRSPSQTHDDFEIFMKNFELHLDEINKNFLSYLSLLMILMLRVKLGLKMIKHRTKEPSLIF